MKKRSLSSIFGRLLWREVFRNWAQSLAIVAIGAIAVTLFVGLSANSASLNQRIDALTSETVPADVYVTTDPRRLDKNADDTEAIQGLLGEGDYLESRFYTFCSIAGKDSTLAVSPIAPKLSKPYDLRVSAESTEIDYFYVDEQVARDLKEANNGEDPVGKETTVSFEFGDFKIDETILAIVDGFLNPGMKNPLREGKLLFKPAITGVMKHPENTTKASPIPVLACMSNCHFQKAVAAALREYFIPLGAAIIYNYAFYDKLGWGDGDIDGSYENFPKGNQYLVKLKDPSTAEAVESKIRSYYQSKETNNLYSLQTLNETAFMSGLHTEADQAFKLTLVFPVVFFVVAVLVILTTLRQNILKRRTDIGTFKAMGLTKGEIHGHFLAQTGALVGIASLIGCVIGPLLLPIIMGKKYSILYTLPARTFVFPWATGIPAVLIFLAISLLATFLITYREISLKPVDSLRPMPMKVRHASKRRSTKPKSAAALSVKMAGRSMIRDPLKSIMVVLGVAGCTALLVCGFGIEDTINYDVATDPYINSNFTVMSHYAQATAESKFELDFREVKDEQGKGLISTYQPFTRFSLDIFAGEDKYTSYLIIMGKPMSFDGAVSPDHMVGEFPKDQVAMSAKVADRLHAKVGDVTSFYVNNLKVEAKIAKIFDAFYGNGIVLHGDSPALSQPYASHTSAWVNAVAGVDAKTLKKAITDQVANVPVIDTAEEWTSRIASIVSSIKTMTNAIKVFALLLAMVVIYNLGLLNFRERMREIATLKVLGFHTLEIGGSLLFEALAMASIGVIGGLAIGQPFMRLVLTINEVEAVHYIFHIFPITFIFSTLFSLLVAVAVNLIMTAKVKGVKAVEALKSVE